jgi:hypothetical protein
MPFDLISLKSFGKTQLLILLLLLFTGAVPSAAADTAQAYVHFGAILLGEAPTGNHNMRRQRVGYLPIGSVVSFDRDAPKERIFNYSEDIQNFEDYIYIRSDFGFSGYIRDDLITLLEQKDILLPLRYNIHIRALDSDKVIEKISRAANKHSSTPVEVLSEEADYYIVRLYRTGDTDAGYIDGRIHKLLVDGEIIVKLSKNTDSDLPDIRVESPSQFVDERLLGFSEFVSERTGETTTRIIDFLSQLNALQCRISSTADAELSAKIFGTGLGLRFTFVLAQQNSINSIKTLSYSTNGQNYASYYELHNVKCIDGIPHRLSNLILLSVTDPSAQIIVSKEDLPSALKENWARFETDRSRKMINIDGFSAYSKFMKHIGQSQFLRNLPRRDRLILSHALLKELAYFSTPD